jgi:hypothetical protein
VDNWPQQCGGPAAGLTGCNYVCSCAEYQELVQLSTALLHPGRGGGRCCVLVYASPGGLASSLPEADQSVSSLPQANSFVDN